MAIKYPDILKSNNPKTFGIVEAKEIAGHRRVSTKEELYSLAAPILSEEYRIVEETDSEGNKTSVEYGTEAAIGQVWFVSNAGKHYKLVNWGNRDNESGWEVFGESSSTADTLTTARKIGITGGAIGTATNFDGSGDINIPVTSLQENALVWSTDDIQNNATLIDSIFRDTTGNRLAFCNPNAITVENSLDGGATWEEYNSNSDKTKLVTPVLGRAGMSIGGTATPPNRDLVQTRVTIDAITARLYFEINKILIQTSGVTGKDSSSSKPTNCKIEYQTYEKYGTDNWITYKDIEVIGQPGWNSISTNGLPNFGYAADPHIRLIRFTFYKPNGCGEYIGSLQNIAFLSLKITEGGNTFSKTGHIYEIDVNQNATFPANITATKHITKGGTADQVVLGDGTLKSLSEIGGKTYSVATPDSDGVMSKEDKIKLDSLSTSTDGGMTISGTVNLTIGTFNTIGNTSLSTYGSVFRDMSVGEMRMYLVADSSGNLPSTSETAVTVPYEGVLSPAQVYFGKSQAFGVSVGDICVLFKKSSLLNICRIIPLNDVKPSNGDFPGADGLSTVWDKNRINKIDGIEWTANHVRDNYLPKSDRFPSRPDWLIHVDYCVDNGVYPTCDAASMQVGLVNNYVTLIVHRTSTADNGGYNTVEQTAYGRGADEGKIYKRIIFYNGSSTEYGDWKRIDSESSVIEIKYTLTESEYGNHDIVDLYNIVQAISARMYNNGWLYNEDKSYDVVVKGWTDNSYNGITYANFNVRLLTTRDGHSLGMSGYVDVAQIAQTNEDADCPLWVGYICGKYLIENDGMAFHAPENPNFIAEI